MIIIFAAHAVNTFKRKTKEELLKLLKTTARNKCNNASRGTGTRKINE